MVKTYTVTIALGLKESYNGKQHSIDEVVEACRSLIEKEKICISVTPTKFCYPGGIEDGCFIHLIQYPRFIVRNKIILRNAYYLALHLRKTFKQHGVTLITPKQTLTYYDGEWVENIRE